MTAENRSTLQTAANLIKNETALKNNTHTRVGGTLLDIVDSALLAAEPMSVSTYTVATLPSAATYDGAVIRVSDGYNGRPCLAMSDGTDWWVVGTQQGKVASSTPSTTIASGVITVTNAVDIAVDTEGAAASDDLDTINGTVNGQLLILRAVSSARTVVLKDGTGNLKLSGDITLDNNEDRVLLRSNGTNLFQIAPVSDNGA